MSRAAHALCEVLLYVDGACLMHDGNKMGAGIIAIAPHHKITKTWALPLGPGTNNEAELRAILEGLKRVVKDRGTTRVIVHSDSAWAIGALSGRFPKLRCHRALVAEIAVLAREFHSIGLTKVKGHVGHVGNEAADKLAGKAARMNP